MVSDQYYITWATYNVYPCLCRPSFNLKLQRSIYKSYEDSNLARVGIVVMDFPEPEYISNIIRFNFQGTAFECSSLKLIIILIISLLVFTETNFILFLGSVKFVTKGCPQKHPELLRRVFPRPRIYRYGVRCCGKATMCITPKCSIGKKNYEEALKYRTVR